MKVNAAVWFLHLGDEICHRILCPRNMGNTFPSPIEHTHQLQFALYANEHCHATRCVSSATSVVVSSSTLVASYVLATNTTYCVLVVKLDDIPATKTWLYLPCHCAGV